MKMGNGRGLDGRIGQSGYYARHASFIFNAVVFLLLGAVLVYLVESFVHNHSNLDRLTKHQDALLVQDHLNSADWDHVWKLAQASRDEAAFLAAVKSEGLSRSQLDMHAQNTVNPVVTQVVTPVQTVQTVTPAQTTQAPAGPPAGSTTPAAAVTTPVVTQPQIDPLKWVPGPGESMDPEMRPVNGGPPNLSVKLAKALSINNTIIVTIANYALLDFATSWVDHLKNLGLNNFLVGATDIEMGKALVKLGIPAFAMYELHKADTGVGKERLQWGGKSFFELGRQRIASTIMILSDAHLNLLLTDVDVAIINKRVLQYMESVPEAQVLASSDNLFSKNAPGDEGLEVPMNAQAPMNIGILYFKYHVDTVRFLRTWLDVIVKDEKYWDQNAFNDVARAGWDPVRKLHPTNPRLFVGFNGSLAMGVLPVASFSGGHTYFVQHLCEIKKIEPMIVHTTFTYGAVMGKRNRMREAMVFNDPPEYWTGDKFISVHIIEGPNMAPGDFAKLSYAEKKAYHANGVKQQLAPVYAGIAIAHMFDRALIVPKMACFCDRYWTPLDDCRLPGALEQRLPFTCAQDYILDPIALTDDTSTIVTRWREHSFLENPRCPTSLKQSKLTIYMSTDPAVTTPVERWSAQDGGPSLVLPRNVTEPQLRTMLKPYEHIQHWRFMDAVQAFRAGFANQTEQFAYQRRMDRLKPQLQPDNM